MTDSGVKAAPSGRVEPSSSGQDAALSRRQPEFDSPSGHCTQLDPRLVALLFHLQFEINCASSVAIEVPGLRPYARALRDV